MKNIRKSDALIIQPSITSYIGSKPKVLTQYLLISAPAGKQNPVMNANIIAITKSL